MHKRTTWRKNEVKIDTDKSLPDTKTTATRQKIGYKYTNEKIQLQLPLSM